MRAILFVSLAAALAACGSSGGGPDAADNVDCSTVTGTDTFVVGLEHQGAAGLMDFKMMSADPAPPARNDNMWVVQIDAMSSGVVGAPMDNLNLTVTPFMPAHQHGSPKPVVVTPTGNPGEYQLYPVFLWMPGVWQTTIQATDSTGSTSDSAVYTFCIAQ